MKDVPLTLMKPLMKGTQRGIYLSGYWLVLARLLWLVVVLVSLITCLLTFVDMFSATLAVYTQKALDPQSVWSTTFHIELLISWMVGSVLWCAVGTFLFWQTWSKRKQPVDLFIFFVSLTLVTLGLALPSLLSPAPPPYQPVWLMSLHSWHVFLAIIFTVFLLFLFPDGRLAPRIAVVPLGIWLFINVCTFFFPTWSFTSWIITFIYPLHILLTASALAYLVYKYRWLLTPQQRLQSRWAVWSWLVLLGIQLVTDPLFWAFANSLLAHVIEDTLFTVAFLFLPLAFSVALLRDHLWESSLLIRRTLVSGILTAGIIGAYIMVVGGLSWPLQGQGNPLIALLATGVIALLFHPVRQRLQRGINRLFYGERDNPSVILSLLGKQMEAAVVPQEGLSRIVETIAQALKLPAVAIALNQEQGSRIVAAYGQPGEQRPPVQIPLLSQHEQVGTLLCTPRQEEEALSDQDRRLLNTLALQVGAVVHAARLTIELQQSRERLVTAREEERRRLCRDLHDGLGPTLASLSQRIDTASELLSEQPGDAVALLQTIKGQMRTTITDIRHLVYALRPPILDEFGLVSALREHAIPEQQSSDLSIHLTVPKLLPPLSAAIEVAAFHIIEEALTNVVRHAQARQCEILLELVETGELVLTVTDDGKGLPEQYWIGVGMHSMRERAEELGGSCDIYIRPTGGTQVRVRLPVVKESSVVKEEHVWTPSVS